MRDILGPRSREVLAALAASSSLLAFDFDGTLAPIVSRRGQARMRAVTRRLLAEAVRAYPCAIISGRGEADARARLQGVRVDAVIGNHGIEPLRNARYPAMVRAWRRRLEISLAALDGVEIEDKAYSLAVHYRRAARPADTVERIRGAVAELPGVRVIGGKRVVNLVPEGAPHKGQALLALRARLGCQRALYVGDDETDEDAFALGGGDLITVRVGRHPRSRATHYLADQRDVDELLARLVELRWRP